MSYEQARLRRLKDAAVSPAGDYVLDWMQLYRRLERNHALDYYYAYVERLRTGRDAEGEVDA